MKLLIFGGSGQLGFEILKSARSLNFELYAPVSSEVNITDKDQINFLIKKINPDVVINCSAYTAVDLAEDNQDLAYQVNKDGAENLALACQKNGQYLIHVSTDYVFDGKKTKPYKESDQTNPLSIYGKSKLAGEQIIQEIIPENSLIVRTSSLHGQNGSNFVHTMLKLFSERDSIKVVADQKMTATWVGWLANVLIDLSRLKNTKKTTGIIHASCAGELSWHDFASEIYRLAKDHNNKIKPNILIEKINLSDFPAKAERPLYSCLDCSLLEKTLGYSPISWKEGLTNHLNEINYQC